MKLANISISIFIRLDNEKIYEITFIFLNRNLILATK